MILIVDDEIIFAKKLKKELVKYYQNENIIIMSEFDYDFFDKNDIDILFLDIELKKENGIEMALKYREQGYNNYIIFVSSHDDFVYNTFDVKPFYFIRKSKLNHDLEKCISLINRERSIREMHVMIDKQLIKLTDVLYIESQGNYVKYVGSKDKIILERRIKLSDVEEELEKYHFIKCHKSYIVNASLVTKARTNYLIINNCVKIPVSRNEQKHFIEKYHDYYIWKKSI